MLFDQRTRAKLQAAGLDSDTLRQIESEVAADARETADDVEAFFAERDVVYSDMDLTHARDDHPEHDLRFVDLYTHSQDIRGYVRFETWGAWVAGARMLTDRVVELELGPTVHDRVRFARDRAALE
jgi:hypothetical protein